MGICRPLWNEARRITTNIVKLPEAAEKAAVLSHGIPTLREPSIPVRRWRHDGTHCDSPCVNDARPAPHGLFLRKRVRPGAAVGPHPRHKLTIRQRTRMLRQGRRK